MKQLTSLGIILIVALLIAGWVCGCEESKHGEVFSGDSLQLEAGAAVSTTARVDAASSADNFSSGDLPLEAGRRLIYASNSPGTTVTVSFNLQGPWKFTAGSDTTTLTIATTSKATAPDQEQFPDASVAVASSLSSSASRSEYVFESKDDNAWLSYGRVTNAGATSKYSAASKAMIFPLAVGNSWTDVYNEVEDGRTTEVTAENTVVGHNQLTVPAGTFDSWLLQTRVTAKSKAGTTTTIDYSWFVPGSGRAAEIVSRPDEHHLPFSSAGAFYRLKSYK